MKLAASLDVNGNTLKDGNKIFTLPSAAGTLATLSDIPQGSFVIKGTATAISSDFKTLTVGGSLIVASSENIGHVYQLNTEEYVSNGSVWVCLGERPVLYVGTEAERLAHSAKDGDEWNETGGTELFHYVYYNKRWNRSAVMSAEHVQISFSVSGGDLVIQGANVIVRILGLSTTTYSIDTNNRVEFYVPMGATYEVEYPAFVMYSKLSNTVITASQNTRTISQVFNYIGNNVCSVLLEQSNPALWTRSGDTNLVDNYLLNTSGDYGTYVIDEANKMYAKLDPENHTRFKDTDPSTGEVTYTNWTGTWGNAFRRLPRVYYRVQVMNNQSYLIVSNQEISGGHYIEEDWIGTYKGSVVGGKLLSQPERSTTQSTTMLQFWKYALANDGNTDTTYQNSNYGLVNYFDQQKLIMLHLAAFGTSNSESTMGKGLQDAGRNYWAHTTGKTASIGDVTGQALYSGTYYMNKLFGIEDLAGATWEFRPNIRFTNSGSIAVVYEGNIVSNEATGRTFTKLNNASSAYVTHMALGEYFDIVPTAVGGSNATYWCDGTWASASGEILLVGGSSSDGSVAGLSCPASYLAFSISSANIGARLSFVGDISGYTLVTGAELAALH